MNLFIMKACKKVSYYLYKIKCNNIVLCFYFVYAHKAEKDLLVRSQKQFPQAHTSITSYHEVESHAEYCQ